MKIQDSCIFTNPIWYNAPDYEASYLINYKCASTAIRRAMGYPRKSTKADARAFTLLRDPIARAISIYKELESQNKAGEGLTVWLQSLERYGFYDSHMIPQNYWVEKAAEQGEDIRLYTDIKQVAEFLGLEEIPRANISRGDIYPTTEDIHLIKEVWAKDVELFDRVSYGV